MIKRSDITIREILDRDPLMEKLGYKRFLGTLVLNSMLNVSEIALQMAPRAKDEVENQLRDDIMHHVYGDLFDANMAFMFQSERNLDPRLFLDSNHPYTLAKLRLGTLLDKIKV